MSLLATCRSLPGPPARQAVIQVPNPRNARSVQCGMTRTVPSSATASTPNRGTDPRNGGPSGHAGRVLHGWEPLLTSTPTPRSARPGSAASPTAHGHQRFHLPAPRCPDFPDRMRRTRGPLETRPQFLDHLDSCDPEIHETNRGLQGRPRMPSPAVFHAAGCTLVNLASTASAAAGPSPERPRRARHFREGFALALPVLLLRRGTRLHHRQLLLSHERGRGGRLPGHVFGPVHPLRIRREKGHAAGPAGRGARIQAPHPPLHAPVLPGRPHRPGRGRSRADLRPAGAVRTSSSSTPQKGTRPTPAATAAARISAHSGSCATCPRTTRPAGVATGNASETPSELFGPLGRVLDEALATALRKFASGPVRFSTWLTDLRYYLACDTFDGTRPMVRRSWPDSRAGWGKGTASPRRAEPISGRGFPKSPQQNDRDGQGCGPAIIKGSRATTAGSVRNRAACMASRETTVDQKAAVHTFASRRTRQHNPDTPKAKGTAPRQPVDESYVHSSGSDASHKPHGPVHALTKTRMAAEPGAPFQPTQPEEQLVAGQAAGQGRRHHSPEIEDAQGQARAGEEQGGFPLQEGSQGNGQGAEARDAVHVHAGLFHQSSGPGMSAA